MPRCGPSAGSGRLGTRATVDFKTRWACVALVDLTGFFAILAGLFAIVNPFGVIPTYIALTEHDPPKRRRRIVTKAVFVGAAVMLLFGLLGERIFSTFDISLPAFRIAGGILIFMVAMDMLRGERPKQKSNDAEIADAITRESIGITPLAVPLLAGPGAITTLMILIATHPASTDRLLIHGASLLVFAATWPVLLAADKLSARLGQSGLQVFTRIMGLLLAAIAVEFVLTGLGSALPGLLTPG